jgi:hypothetical protein
MRAVLLLFGLSFFALCVEAQMPMLPIQTGDPEFEQFSIAASPSGINATIRLSFEAKATSHVITLSTSLSYARYSNLVSPWPVIKDEGGNVVPSTWTGSNIGYCSRPCNVGGQIWTTSVAGLIAGADYTIDFSVVGFGAAGSSAQFYAKVQ